jgi:nucleotide-binding universal stress UspA family protein
MRLKSLAVGTSDTFKIDPRKIIIIEGFNGRIDFGDIESLALDIHENGLSQPLTVRVGGPNADTIKLVDGERRLRAILLLLEQGHEIPTVKCQSEGSRVKPLDRLFMQLSANSGKNFTLLEKAFLYERILIEEPTLNATILARRSQETKQAVSRALKLARKGSAGLHQLINTDKIAASTALEIIDLHPEDHQAQDEVAKAAMITAEAGGKSKITDKHLPRVSKAPATGGTEDPEKKPQADESNPPWVNPDVSGEEPPAPDDEDEEEVDEPPANDEGDTTALDRIKNTPDTNRDGSTIGAGNNGGAGGGTGGYAKPEKRIKNLETLLEDNEREKCNTQHWDCLDAALNYLSGEKTITDLKKLLKSQS